MIDVTTSVEDVTGLVGSVPLWATGDKILPAGVEDMVGRVGSVPIGATEGEIVPAGVVCFFRFRLRELMLNLVDFEIINHGQRPWY